MACQTRMESAILLMDGRPQVTLASIRVDLFVASHMDSGLSTVREAAQTPEYRAYKHLKSNIGRYRIPRQADELNSFVFANCKRLPGPHVYPPEIQFSIC